MATGGPDQVNPIVAEAAPRLTLIMGAGTEYEMCIPCRRVVTLIGSRPGCKVNLQHRSVDPVHVAIVNDGSCLFAVDLVTVTGTLLNGLKMEHEALSDGDVLTIQTWEFRVEIQAPSPTGRADAHPFGLDPSPHVMALEDLSSGRLLRPGRDLCIIGRRAGCDIAISDLRVSRVHVLLLSYFGHPAIFDLLTSNHTLINDRAIQYRRLRDGDLIAISDTRLRVHLRGSVVTEMAARNARPGNGQKVEPPQDMIDIQTAESASRWRIVDNLARTTRKQ